MTDPAELSRPVSPYCEEYLTFLAIEKSRATNTTESYRRDLYFFEEFLSQRGSEVITVTGDLIYDYVKFLQVSGNSRATVARAMSVIRGLYAYITDEEVISKNPTLEVSYPSAILGLPKALSEGEVSAIIEAASGQGPLQIRDRAILEVLYGCGLRISELVSLSLLDVVEMESDSGIYLLKVFGKGSKERVVPMGSFAYRALARWLSIEGRPKLVPEKWKRRGDAEALFLNARGGRLTRQGAWLVVKTYGDKLGLADKLSPHVLRHSCATHMLDHGADIRSVQEFLGHASITTTQIYTKVSTARLREIYDQAHPRSREI